MSYRARDLCLGSMTYTVDASRNTPYQRNDTLFDGFIARGVPISYSLEALLSLLGSRKELSLITCSDKTFDRVLRTDVQDVHFSIFPSRARRTRAVFNDR